MAYSQSNWNTARSEMRHAGVYIIRNLLNGDCYVGQAQSMFERWSRHISNARAGKKYHLQRAIRKYGIESFEFDVLCYCDLGAADFQTTIDAHETFFIGFYAQHGKLYPAYNNRPDARSNRGVPSPMKGKRVSGKALENMRAANKIREHVLTPEGREAKRKFMKENTLFGKEDFIRQTIETRRKNNTYKTEACLTHMKNICDAKKIPIERIDLKTGETVRYESAADAERDGFERSAIGHVLNGKAKTSGGCAWRYATETTDIQDILAEVVPRSEWFKKMIERVDLTTGEIKEYASAADAAREDGFGASNIRACANGRAKTHGGYGWGFVCSLSISPHYLEA